MRNEDETMTEHEFPPCVHCGECCKAVPCIYGEWGDDGCLYLIPHEEDGYRIYKCGLYDEIMKQPDADIVPAFGGGCCRTLFNPVRDRIIRRRDE